MRHHQKGCHSLRMVKQGAVMTHRWTDSAKEYVLSGYRPDDCYSLSVALFRFHNETINIWSHIAGFVLVSSHIFRPHEPVCPRLSYVLSFHIFCGMLCAGCSVLYHIGECFSREWYNKLLKMDMAAAFLCCVAHTVMVVSFELHHLNPPFATGLLVVVAAIAQIGLCIFLFGDATSYPFFSAAVYTSPLMLIGVAWVSAFHSARNWFLLRWSLIFMVTLIIWLSKLPEKVLPAGTVDFFGNSHNLMHLLVIVVWYMLYNEYGMGHPQQRFNW